MILGISADAREAVDELVDMAPQAGGVSAGEPQDDGFTHSRSFHDPDRHHWEIVWMDPAAVAESLHVTAAT